MRPIGRHLLVALGLLFLAGGARAQAPCGTWNPVAMPEPDGNGLADVSASSASDIWAVWKAIYHWDGAGWSLVPAPGLGSPDTVLVGIAAVAPGNAWAVGYTALFGSPQTLVQHWDGSSWSIVPSPVIAGGSQLDDVAALGADDAWAVGSRAGGLPEFQATRVTLTARWNGSQWAAVPSPNVSNRSHELLDVEMIASNDVWAVGSSRNIGEDYRTLILHWDGSSWAITPSPNLPGENVLHGVSGTSANDVWAVGYAWDGITSRQIFLHWDGSAWSQVNGPGGPTACVGCTGDVLAMGPNDIWAVGTTIGHWNGTQWSLVPNPEVPGAMGITLRSLAKVGACDAWAVGSSFGEDGMDDALSVHLAAGGGTVNLAPVALASANPPSGPAPLEVHFSSAGSHDPDGSIVSYHWNFGDGTYSTSSEPDPVHTYVQTGALTYYATLEIEDDDGAVTEANVQVRITPPLHVESQSVAQVPDAGASAWYGRNEISIADRDALPVAGAMVTAEYHGPMSGIVTGTTGSDGRVTLETEATPDTTLPWCFTVINVEKSGCIYVPASNLVTEQCESDASLSAEGPAGRGPLALRVSPNPSREAHVIRLTLPDAQQVRMTILDSSGRQVRVVGAAALPAGDHVFGWDGRDTAGRQVGPGVYFVTVTAGSERISTRVLRIN